MAQDSNLFDHKQPDHAGSVLSSLSHVFTKSISRIIEIIGCPGCPVGCQALLRWIEFTAGTLAGRMILKWLLCRKTRS